MSVEVAQVLREARDLMNTNGRHWMKGEMSMYIDESFLEQVESGWIAAGTISPKAQVGDTVYCTWGGIKEVADEDDLRVAAMEALVSIIDPESFREYTRYMDDERGLHEEYAEQDEYYKNQYPTFDHLWMSQIDSREEQLGDIIARWNDNDKRTWADVRKSLTKAATVAKKSK